MPVKILYPLLEIIVAIIVLVYIPERIFRLFGLLLKDRDKGKFFAFVRENVMGLLIGIAISFAALFLIGDTLENVLHRAIRNGFAAVQQMLGVDPATVCVNRVQSEQRWTGSTFVNEAAKFNIGSHYSLTERQKVLAEGNLLLLFERGLKSPDDVYEKALRLHCGKST